MAGSQGPRALAKVVTGRVGRCLQDGLEWWLFTQSSGGSMDVERKKITPGITNLSPKLAISFNREHRGVTGLRLWQRRVVGSGNVSG